VRLTYAQFSICPGQSSRTVHSVLYARIAMSLYVIVRARLGLPVRLHCGKVYLMATARSRASATAKTEPANNAEELAQSPVDNVTGETSKDVVRLHRREVSRSERLEDEQLREVRTFADALALAAEAYGNVQTITEFELGSGFKILPDRDKSRLIGVSLIILHYQFNEGEFGEFVSVMLVTMHGDRLVLNDGSTGIYAQLCDVAKTGRFGGIAIPRGLRVSGYPTCFQCGAPRPDSEETCDDCGDQTARRSKGETYYLDTSE
jgi:hypothetical protein